MAVANATIRAVNALAARWAGEIRADGNSVFSAAGVWPLLAFLADGAAGAARAELADALGVPADQAAGAARELLAGMGAARGLDTALGLWTKRTLELREPWAAGLPAEAHGALTGDLGADRAALDAWAARRTGGLVEAMPVDVTDRTELVLASALGLRTRWLRPFREGGPLDTPHWPEGDVAALTRESAVLDRIGVADTPDGHVTELKVLGDNALDVHLLLGEERMTPGQVLGAGVGLLARRHPVLPGSRLPYGVAGPGVRVERERSLTPDPPTLKVATPAFRVTARHDLLERHELFGLTTARDQQHGHFPGISGTLPLAIGSAGQSAVARFGATGFEAAVVTAFGVVGAAGVPRLPWLVTTVRARFDRPFGFLAVHRHSRLVLAAGWVADPERLPEDPEDPGSYEDPEDSEDSEGC
ncbi:serpin family protein [Streptomyces sp. DSM 15324]|uniref:serpin family protein n=1 Tax=Streptomyces sp. DSM 15324 TaxID=1739111 RepID=UPI00074932AD|nr:serpin family protein [Streptomyces sp. DSM 15324]KUO11786.1 proteinase inhibitor I4 serpin [Streptomyces sp. DSM 15324]